MTDGVTRVAASDDADGAPKALAAAAVRPGRRLAVSAGLAAAILAADQLAKTVVLRTIEPGEIVDLGPVHAVRAFNTGMAFSLGRGRGGLVVVIVALVAGLVWAARRELSRHHPGPRPMLPAVGFGLLIGGALGNLVDRLARSPGVGRGAVVDFIDVKGFLDFWPVFNLADIALTVGAVTLMIASWVTGERPTATR
jgi:signal peptidase II